MPIIILFVLFALAVPVALLGSFMSFVWFLASLVKERSVVGNGNRFDIFMYIYICAEKDMERTEDYFQNVFAYCTFYTSIINTLLAVYLCLLGSV